MINKGETCYNILAREPEKDKKGEVSRLTCSAIDITEQKRLADEWNGKEMQAEVQRRLLE